MISIYITPSYSSSLFCGTWVLILCGLKLVWVCGCGFYYLCETSSPALKCWACLLLFQLILVCNLQGILGNNNNSRNVINNNIIINNINVIKKGIEGARLFPTPLSISNYRQLPIAVKPTRS